MLFKLSPCPIRKWVVKPMEHEILTEPITQDLEHLLSAIKNIVYLDIFIHCDLIVKPREGKKLKTVRKETLFLLASFKSNRGMKRLEQPESQTLGMSFPGRQTRVLSEREPFHFS